MIIPIPAKARHNDTTIQSFSQDMRANKTISTQNKQLNQIKLHMSQNAEHIQSANNPIHDIQKVLATTYLISWRRGYIYCFSFLNFKGFINLIRIRRQIPPTPRCSNRTVSTQQTRR